MQQEFDHDELLIIEALRQLAERTNHEIKSEHALSLAYDFAKQRGEKVDDSGLEIY